MKNDRKILICLIIFGIFIVVFGFFNLKERIEGPFRLPKLPQIQITNEDIRQLLAKKDTDNDGLSDEEEIFQYRTSIYLDDSDSDGYNDKEEIDAGSDPTNPESTPLKKVAEKKSEVIIPQENKKEPTIDEIREMLVKMGIPKETLDKVDDETIKKLYNETVKETGVNPEEIAPGGLATIDFSKILQGKSVTPSSEFENLNPQEIRQLLLANGADPNILSQIDDENLKILFLQALQETQ